MTPYQVQRHDRDDGSVSFEIWDTRDNARFPIAVLTDALGPGKGRAEQDAERIASRLNAGEA